MLGSASTSERALLLLTAQPLRRKPQKPRPRLPGFANVSKRWRVTSWDMPHTPQVLVDLDDYPPVKPMLQPPKSYEDQRPTRA